MEATSQQVTPSHVPSRRRSRRASGSRRGAPNPTALHFLVRHEDVEKHRSLSCVEYDECLDAVLRRSWRSWSCGRCKLFSLTRDCRAAEIAHLAGLRPPE